MQTLCLEWDFGQRRIVPVPVAADTVHPASAPVEDYAKAIYSLTVAGDGAASTSQISERLGLTAGSVSMMIKRMHAAGLAEHVPYKGVRLTERGRQLALSVIRRHRLLELFLATSLEIPWEDVHRFADALEHAASDELIELIATKLGDPVSDPHGDPIPSRELAVDEGRGPSLAELAVGDEGMIVRVSDSDPQMLRYLTERQIGIGDRVRMVARHPFDGPCEVLIGGCEHTLGMRLAGAIRVQSV